MRNPTTYLYAPTRRADVPVDYSRTNYVGRRASATRPVPAMMPHLSTASASPNR